MITCQLLKTILLGGCILFFLSIITYAQEPEQDCSGAIVVTSPPDTFSYYEGYGSSEELVYQQNTSCLLGGEENSVWITFTACDTGLLLFQITPDAPSDDFDWSLYDFTNYTCDDVLDSSNEVRCNYSAVPGSTGLNIQYTMVSCSASEPNQCAPLYPYANQRFLLVVNNHAFTSSGFVLSFSGTVDLCFPVVVPQVTRENRFFLYPTLTDGMLQLKNLPTKNNVAIEVMNVYGNNVYGKEVKGNGDNQLQLPPLLPDGFYVLRILIEGKLFGEESFILSR